jgi:hypothetical protein
VSTDGSDNGLPPHKIAAQSKASEENISLKPMNQWPYNRR